MITAKSSILRQAVRAATPLALIVAAFLFFAGHNRPGGGFAAGLVLGAILSIRTVAGIQERFRPIPLLVAGGVVVSLVALAPLLFGEPLLDQIVVETTVPVLGKIKTGTALIFDAGVTLIVVGLVAAVLEALGATELAEDRPRELQ